MRNFLTIADNRRMDGYAIKTRGIAGHLLMQHAGESAVQVMEAEHMLTPETRVLVLNGKGNNGGDGFVIAGQLLAKGFTVEIITLVAETDIRGDARYHYDRLLRQNPDISLWTGSEKQLNSIEQADIIVDALLGTGISGALREPYKTVIEHCNRSAAKRVAVDVPSGLTGDTGDVLTPCIRADLTVSMGFGKQGCLFEPARSHCGKTAIVDIGFPEDALQQAQDTVMEELCASDFPAQKFTRPPDTHKYSAGKVYIIAGSRGFSGAALLASSAALRAGAGLIKLGVPASLGPVAEGLSLETIVEYLPETPAGSLAGNALAALQAGCNWADTVVMGPGLGREPETLELVRKLIPLIECPLVLDADALFALSENIDLLKQRKTATILTPHLGEFRRLTTGESTDPLWQQARSLAGQYGVHLLLKGAPSVLVSPAGQVVVNSTGYAGMATAGSGDVLSGVIGALWSQWNQLPEVLHLAMFAHGAAADLNRSEKGVLGLVAGDIVSMLPAALKAYGGLPH